MALRYRYQDQIEPKATGGVVAIGATTVVALVPAMDLSNYLHQFPVETKTAGFGLATGPMLRLKLQALDLLLVPC